MSTLALIHTVPVVIKPINELARSMMPELGLINLMDDSIIPEIVRAGGITDAVRTRLGYIGGSAREADASAMLITCSSISELAEPLAQRIGLPVYKIDEAMTEQAVRQGKKIAVIATSPTTLEPTCAQIAQKAREAQSQVTIHQELCQEAYDRLAGGDAQEHDRLLLDAVTRLAVTQDVIVLAQVSMARLQDECADIGIPVLASPRLGLSQVRERLVAAGLLSRAS